MIDAPGIYDISAADYHADCCPEPSLSASVAQLLLKRSPRHAWYAHPGLNPNFQPENKKQFDLPTAVHAMLLERDQNRIFVIDARDYKTKAAREARDAHYEKNFIPLRRYEMATEHRSHRQSSSPA